MSTKVEEQSKEQPKVDEYEYISKISINKYDPFQLKSAIDEEIITELDKKSFKEDNLATDIKIAIGLVSTVIAIVSHFYPIPFPKNKPLIYLCISGYILCVIVYYLVEHYLEKDAFFIAKDHKVNALKEAKKIRFCSTIDLLDPVYKFSIQTETIKG